MLVMRLPEWTWRWAWNGFLKWSLLGSFRDDLTVRQRWEIVSSLWPTIKHHHLRPTETWLQVRLPTLSCLCAWNAVEPVDIECRPLRPLSTSGDD